MFKQSSIRFSSLRGFLFTALLIVCTILGGVRVPPAATTQAAEASPAATLGCTAVSASEVLLYGAVEPLGHDFVAVSAGNLHSLGIKSDGTLWAWGYNEYGQLGQGDTEDRWIPTRVGPASNWVAADAGNLHSLAVKSDGTLWAWGANDYGQLGVGLVFLYWDTPIRVGTASNWVAVSAGDNRSFGLRKNGTLWAWGCNEMGTLGIGPSPDVPVPKQVGSGHNWVAASPAFSHTLGLRSDGTAWAWGNNFYFELGIPVPDCDTPAQVGTDANWAAVSAGCQYSLALKADHTLWYWGVNWAWSADKPLLGGAMIPTQIGTDTDWALVSAGDRHSLGLRLDGTLWSWGVNSTGALGLGNTRVQIDPAPVGGDTDWVTVSAGGAHSLGLRSDGSLWAWGLNDHGQLGIGDLDERDMPVKVYPADGSVGFDWGPTPSCVNHIVVGPWATNRPLTFSAQISPTSGTPGTGSGTGGDALPVALCYFRAWALVDGVLYQGPDRTFSFSPVTATIDLDPNTLDLKSKGNFVTGYIELPAGYDVRQIDIPAIFLNGVVPALAKPTAIGDRDRDGIADLMVKFDRSRVQDILGAGDQAQVTISGMAANSFFQGSGTIRVIGWVS